MLQREHDLFMAKSTRWRGIRRVSRSVRKDDGVRVFYKLIHKSLSGALYIHCLSLITVAPVLRSTRTIDEREQQNKNSRRSIWSGVAICDMSCHSRIYNDYTSQFMPTYANSISICKKDNENKLKSSGSPNSAVYSYSLLRVSQ